MTEVRFTVDPSALDYVQLRRILPQEGNARPVVIRLELTGSGYLDYRSGRSVRVRDNFWQEEQSPDWQNLKTDHVVLSTEETQAFYQRFVDAGLFDYRNSKKQVNSARAITVFGCVGFKKKYILTDAPIYTELFDDLLEKFSY